MVFADCEDQAYGCDLTCYDNDGGDCGGTGGGTEQVALMVAQKPVQIVNLISQLMASECCDTAWDEYGIELC